MNELKVSSAPSVFTRFRERFSSWGPWRRAFFIMGIYALLSCILMVLFWVFPPAILIMSPGWEPYLQLANNWTIAIPVGMVVVSVFVTNMSFRMPEDPRFILRLVTLLVCAEIAVLATWNAMAARMYWYLIFAPVLGHHIPIESFPGAWFVSSILRFSGLHGMLQLLFLVGLGVMVIVLLFENCV